MPKLLTQPEINKRMVEWRNLKVLHAKAMAQVVRLQTTITDLKSQLLQKDAHITELEYALEDKEAQRKALSAKLWKAKKDRSVVTAERSGQNKPGAQTGHQSSRRPVPAPGDITDRQIFDLAKCPACKHTVGDVVDTVEKYQEDIDLAPRNKIVRHYTITRHWCPGCEEYVRPVNTPAQNLRRFGPNVMGYILYARYRLRLPLLKIQESLRDLHDFEISEGEIQNQLDDAKELFGEQYDLICELIRAAKVVYADESGWRMDGDNWYIWAFVDKASGAIRYELAETRGGSIAKEALGGTTDQVIVSDGYSTYNSTDSPNQQCWIHLIRVAKEKAGRAKLLYGDLCALYSSLLLTLSRPNAERTPEEKLVIRKQLETIQAKDYNTNKRTGKPMREPVEPLAKEVQARIARHKDQLLVCLDHDNVLPENNTAERAIRPQVILRKIFGGNRSPTGAKIHAVNTSVITTKLTQNPGKSFFEVMLPLVSELHQKPKPADTTTRS
ncbi:MAG: IS66 family transposase [Patescibacteria group bacterium]